MSGGYSIHVGNDTFAALKTYEPRRNLITSISNLWDSTLISAFDHQNDALGRRTDRIDAGGGLPSARTKVFRSTAVQS